MAIVAHAFQFVVGVDTHARTHALSILAAATGVIVDESQFPATEAGMTRAIAWAGTIYQRIVACYRNPDRAAAKTALTKIITMIRRGVPDQLAELVTLGRTMHRRAADVLAYFDRPGTSNGPTEAINGRLEHLPGTALGFRNLTNYITRALLDTGGFRSRIHPLLR